MAIVLFVLATTAIGASAVPSLDITSHHDRQTVKDSAITLSGTASDPAGITAITVSLNQGPWQPAEWSGSGSGPKQSASWSIRLELAEGANIIVVNATNSTNETTTRTIMIDYSIPQSQSGGVLLAGGIIIMTVVLIIILTMRARRPAPRAGDDTNVVKVQAPKDGCDRKPPTKG